MAIDIADIPIKNGDVPSFFVCLPEGIEEKNSPKPSKKPNNYKKNSPETPPKTSPVLHPGHRGGCRGGTTHRAARGGLRGRGRRNAAGFRSADAWTMAWKGCCEQIGGDSNFLMINSIRRCSESSCVMVWGPKKMFRNWPGCACIIL